MHYIVDIIQIAPLVNNFKGDLSPEDLSVHYGIINEATEAGRARVDTLLKTGDIESGTATFTVRDRHGKLVA